MLRRTTLLLSAVCLLAAGVTQFTRVAVAQVRFDDLAGDYVVVSVRRNSFVAAQSGNELTDGPSPIGQAVSIGSQGLTLEGLDCDRWQLDEERDPADFSADPLLVDLRLPPVDSPSSGGDKRLLRAFQIRCEGEPFSILYQVDQRVMALSWQNSALYLIVERPLTRPQLSRLQAELKSLKFYDGKINGVFDAATESAVRRWYMYRQPDETAAVPLRPAITENLLDAMNVLTAED